MDSSKKKNSKLISSVRNKVFLLKKKNGKNGTKGQEGKDLDKKLVYSLSKSRIPTLTQLKHLKKFLNKKELWLMRVAAIILLVSLVFVVYLFMVVIFKVIAMSVTTGSGGVGGIFAPALFMGGLTGYMVSRIINYFDFYSYKT